VTKKDDAKTKVDKEAVAEKTPKINKAEFTVLRHSNSKKDFQFFKKNFDRNLTVIQLSNEEYEHFFTNAYRFPFYYHEDLMGNPRFFVPNREFPKLSHYFVKTVFSRP